jgi:hypothetical protein
MVFNHSNVRFGEVTLQVLSLLLGLTNVTQGTQTPMQQEQLPTRLLTDSFYEIEYDRRTTSTTDSSGRARGGAGRNKRVGRE